MALPALKSLEECGDFAHALEPVLVPQLLALPSRLLTAATASVNSTSPEPLLRLYVETNPFVTGLAATLVSTVVFLIVSEINKNYSQVDRCWSIFPTLFNLHYAIWARLAGIPSRRVDAVLLWSTAWSIRLTFNYWRKGGYNVGSEDYRWEWIRGKIPKWAVIVLNITFISFIQPLLLFMMVSPTYSILLASRFEPELSSADIAFTTLELGLVLSELISDGAQWDYQNAKREYQKTAKVPKGYKQADLDRGFLTSGMWAYSRHPNFLAEQTIWFVLYQWSCYACKVLFSYTGIGTFVLFGVFQGSTFVTEMISSSKYPEYAHYQHQVGMFIPTGFRGYKGPQTGPKVIRTSDLAKRQKAKLK